MESCDLLVQGGWVLPVAPSNIVLREHGIAVRDGQIVALEPNNRLTQRFTADQTLDATQHILIPGLINAHGHAAMSLLRGAGEGQALQPWLEETIWPLEAQLVSPEFVRLGTELAIAEMLLSGTTTFSDMYFFPDVVAETAAQIGIRTQIAFPVIDMANVWCRDAKEGINKGLALYDQYKHHERIQVAFGPHAAYTVAPEGLAQVAMYANELDAPVHIHLHENTHEVDIAMQSHGMTWIALLEQLGLLTPNLQAVHMTTVDDEDRARIVANDCSIIHCPSSNMKLASGFCDVGQWQADAVTVGLGTDGAASNNSLDMLHEMRTAALLAKHQLADPCAGGARETLAMATTGSAHALGLGATLGALQPGMQADFVSIRADTISMLPIHDPFASLVHNSASVNVEHVYISGQPMVQNGQLVALDIDQLHRDIQAWAVANTPPN